MSVKKVTVELDKTQVSALLKDAERFLGKMYMEYKNREHFEFQIERAEADVKRWRAIYEAMSY